MLKVFKEHIETNFSFLKHDPFLIAISGGIDSVVLTHMLAALGFQFELAHCNFKLREKAAELDEQFVVSFAKRLGSTLHLTSFDTAGFAKQQKLSIQMAARSLRYTWFDTLLAKQSLKYVLTAHHLDDSLETFLINFSRGTGLDGLTGIPERNGSILRPILPFTRSQITNYAKKNHLNWRDDKSNLDSKYLRNKIRHELVPMLGELNPNFLKSFQKTLDHLNQSKELIELTVSGFQTKVIERDHTSKIKISLAKLTELAKPKLFLYHFLKEYNFTDWKAIDELLHAQPGKYLLSPTHRLVKDRDELLLHSIELIDSAVQYTIEKDQSELMTDSFSLLIRLVERYEQTSNSIIYVDADLLRYPLEVRRPRPGDFFYPLGMEGKKKVSKYFKDEKFSLVAKEQTWLLTSDSEIIWVVGHRLDERFKVTEKTKKFLRIECSK